jgi:hypothetical protein
MKGVRCMQIKKLVANMMDEKASTPDADCDAPDCDAPDADCNNDN